MIWLSFLSTFLISSVNGDYTIDCNGSTQCQNKQLICNQTDNCYIKCKGKQSCEGTTFYCPSGSYDCDLNCIGESSCDSVTLNATEINGKSGQLDIFCTGLQSCHGATFYSPSGFSDCHLNCNGESSCESVKLNAKTIIGGRLKINAEGINTFAYSHTICPTSGRCWITTSGASKTFYSSIVDASHAIAGNLKVQHDVNSDWNAKHMNISCPINGSCIVNCGKGYGGCAYSYFIAQLTTTQLIISAEGGKSLQHSHITCPKKQGSFLENNCFIYSIGHHGDSIEYMEIKVIESFHNIQVYGIISEYDEDKTPTIYCMDDYSESCKLFKISDTQWRCSDKDSPCNNGIFHTYTPGPTMVISDGKDSSSESNIKVNIYVIIVGLSTIAIVFGVLGCNIVCTRKNGIYSSKQQFYQVENHENKNETEIIEEIQHTN